MYGLTPDLRVGGELGAFVGSSGGGKDNGGGTNYGFAMGPAASYDVWRRREASFYAVTRPLNANYQSGSGDIQTRWNVSFASAGLGLEGRAPTSGFGVALEEELLRLGILHFVPGKTETDFALFSPSFRVSLRYYF